MFNVWKVVNNLFFNKNFSLSKLFTSLFIIYILMGKPKKKKRLRSPYFQKIILPMQSKIWFGSRSRFIDSKAVSILVISQLLGLINFIHKLFHGFQIGDLYLDRVGVIREKEFENEFLFSFEPLSDFFYGGVSIRPLELLFMVSKVLLRKLNVHF